jgi:hypothetical protein
MSMETHVFFRGPLPRKAALQKAMRELGFAFFLKPDTGSLEDQRGFMPMTLRREDTGVEFDVFEGREAIRELAGDDDVDPAFDRCANFRWGGDRTEMLAGLCAAAALAKLVGGLVCDEAEDRLLSVDEAVTVAKRYFDAAPKPDVPKQPGTRSADIKRYLKPLLKLRPDLVLCGGHLLVRPVRHILRGVALGRTYDKYELSVFRQVRPLFCNSDAYYFGDNLGGSAFKVWQPYFLPLLYDTLAEDIFDRLGLITSLNGFADWLETRQPHWSALLRTLLLAGERDRAVAVVERYEREARPDDRYGIQRIQAQRALLDRDIALVCEEAHREETANATAFGLDEVWEPSPFPIELPAASRRSVDEPAFNTTPWIPKTTGLVVAPPEQPGEVRFADQWLKSDDRVALLAPLTREEAQRRHEASESYCLATRLRSGELLIFDHSSDWHPNDPERSDKPNRVHNKRYYLWVHGSANRAFASFVESWTEPGRLEMQSADIRSLDWTSTWHCFIDVKQRTISIHPPPEHRAEGRAIYRDMSESDFALCVREPPRFGEFADLLERVNIFLSLAGYGRFTATI